MPQVKAALWNDRVESLVLELAADLEVSVEARPDQARRAADAFVASMMESLVAEYEEEFAAELEADFQPGLSEEDTAFLDELERALFTVNQHLGVILQNLESGSRHMGEFARVVRDNPSRLIRGSSSKEPGE